MNDLHGIYIIYIIIYFLSELIIIVYSKHLKYRGLGVQLINSMLHSAHIITLLLTLSISLCIIISLVYIYLHRYTPTQTFCQTMNN